VRRAAARLLTLGRVVNLRRVHADVAHLLDAVAEPDVHGVAVDHADDDAIERDRNLGDGGHGAEQECRQQHERA